MPVKWTTKWHSAMSRDIPRAHEGRIRHARVFQNGCHMERSKAMSFLFSFKYHKQIWLQFYDSGTGIQNDNLTTAL